MTSMSAFEILASVSLMSIRGQERPELTLPGRENSTALAGESTEPSRDSKRAPYLQKSHRSSVCDVSWFLREHHESLPSSCAPSPPHSRRGSCNSSQCDSIPHPPLAANRRICEKEKKSRSPTKHSCESLAAQLFSNDVFGRFPGGSPFEASDNSEKHTPMKCSVVDQRVEKVRRRAAAVQSQYQAQRMTMLLETEHNQREAAIKKSLYFGYHPLQLRGTWTIIAHVAKFANHILKNVQEIRDQREKRQRRFYPLFLGALRRLLRRVRARIALRNHPQRPTGAILGTDKVLALFPPTHLEHAARTMELRYCFENEWVVWMGMEEDEAFVMHEGRADVMMGSTRVFTIGPGAVFGAVGMISGEPRTATIVARGGACLVWVLSRRNFEACGRGAAHQSKLQAAHQALNEMRQTNMRNVYQKQLTGAFLSQFSLFAGVSRITLETITSVDVTPRVVRGGTTIVSSSSSCGRRSAITSTNESVAENSPPMLLLRGRCAVRVKRTAWREFSNSGASIPLCLALRLMFDTVDTRGSTSIKTHAHLASHPANQLVGMDVEDIVRLRHAQRCSSTSNRHKSSRHEVRGRVTIDEPSRNDERPRLGISRRRSVEWDDDGADLSLDSHLLRRSFASRRSVVSSENSEANGLEGDWVEVCSIQAPAVLNFATLFSGAFSSTSTSSPLLSLPLVISTITDCDLLSLSRQAIRKQSNCDLSQMRQNVLNLRTCFFPTWYPEHCAHYDGDVEHEVSRRIFQDLLSRPTSTESHSKPHFSAGDLESVLYLLQPPSSVSGKRTSHRTASLVWQCPYQRLFSDSVAFYQKRRQEQRTQQSSSDHQKKISKDSLGASLGKGGATRKEKEKSSSGLAASRTVSADSTPESSPQSPLSSHTTTLDGLISELVADKDRCCQIRVEPWVLAKGSWLFFSAHAGAARMAVCDPLESLEEGKIQTDCGDDYIYIILHGSIGTAGGVDSHVASHPAASRPEPVVRPSPQATPITSILIEAQTEIGSVRTASPDRHNSQPFLSPSPQDVNLLFSTLSPSETSLSLEASGIDSLAVSQNFSAPTRDASSRLGDENHSVAVSVWPPIGVSWFASFSQALDMLMDEMNVKLGASPSSRRSASAMGDNDFDKVVHAAGGDVIKVRAVTQLDALRIRWSDLVAAIQDVFLGAQPAVRGSQQLSPPSCPPQLTVNLMSRLALHFGEEYSQVQHRHPPVPSGMFQLRVSPTTTTRAEPPQTPSLTKPGRSQTVVSAAIVAPQPPTTLGSTSAKASFVRSIQGSHALENPKDALRSFKRAVVVSAARDVFAAVAAASSEGAESSTQVWSAAVATWPPAVSALHKLVTECLSAAVAPQGVALRSLGCDGDAATFILSSPSVASPRSGSVRRSPSSLSSSTRHRKEPTATTPSEGDEWSNAIKKLQMLCVEVYNPAISGLLISLCSLMELRRSGSSAASRGIRNAQNGRLEREVGHQQQPPHRKFVLFDVGADEN